MKPEDIKKTPKLFCESINIAYTPEFFVLSMSSGSQTNIYALTPQHAKRLSQYLTHQLTEYEKSNSAIEATWTPHVVSPLQPKKPQ
jgi:hypothetical protein